MPGGWKRSAHYNPWAGLPAARSVLPHPPRLIFPSGSIPPAELPAVAGQTVPVPERHCRRGFESRLALVEVRKELGYANPTERTESYSGLAVRVNKR